MKISLIVNSWENFENLRAFSFLRFEFHLK
jgi:hypothetical protein